MVNAHPKRKQESVRSRLRTFVRSRQSLDILLLGAIDDVTIAFIGAIAALLLIGARTFTELVFAFLGLIAFAAGIRLVRWAFQVPTRNTRN